MGTFIVSFIVNGFVQSAQGWTPLTRRFSPQVRASMGGRGAAATEA